MLDPSKQGKLHTASRPVSGHRIGFERVGRTPVVAAKVQGVDDTAPDGTPVQALLCLYVHHMQLHVHIVTHRSQFTFQGNF